MSNEEVVQELKDRIEVLEKSNKIIKIVVFCLSIMSGLALGLSLPLLSST